MKHFLILLLLVSIAQAQFGTHHWEKNNKEHITAIPDTVTVGVLEITGTSTFTGITTFNDIVKFYSDIFISLAGGEETSWADSDLDSVLVRPKAGGNFGAYATKWVDGTTLLAAVDTTGGAYFAGNVGIGTTAPYHHTSIVDAASGAGTGLNIVNSTFNKNRVSAATASDSASAQIYIDASGNGRISLKANNGRDFQIYPDGADYYLYTPNGGDIYINPTGASGDVFIQTGGRNCAKFNGNGDVKIGPASVIDNLIPSFSILGDADSDASATTTETLSLQLTGNATPTAATWDWNITQAAGVRFFPTATQTIELRNDGTDAEVTYFVMYNTDGEACYIYPNSTQNGIVVASIKP